jgi:putative ABC transport system permease protein
MGGYRRQRGVQSWWRSEAEIRRDVDEELTFHIETRVRELVASGVSMDAARAEAEREFGDLEDARTYMVAIEAGQQRRVRVREVLLSVVQDVRVGWRSLVRDRGFAAVAVATLALGIGANSAMYTLVDGVLLRDLPYHRPDELVAVSPGHSFMRAEYALARERLSAVASLGGYQAGVGLSVADDGDAVRLIGALVSANLLETLGVEPFGRGFAREHEQAGRGDVALISHRLWRGRYGGDPAALGSRIVIEGTPHRIVGVLPNGFAFPDDNTDIWLPATIDAGELGTYWGIGGMNALGRLRPGATIEQVQAELRVLGNDMRLENPFWTPKPGYRSDNIVMPLHDAVVDNARPMLLVLMGAVLLVWLIACANVGNLMLARGLTRERELAVRMALGAGHSRVIRQLITESTMLASIGGAVGLALGWILLRALVPHLPADLPRLDGVRIDARALCFTTAASLLAAITFGVLPALRVVPRHFTSALKEGVRTGTGVRSRRLSSVVVIAEVALAMVLVAAAGLLVRSLSNLSRVDTGFVSDHVITARLSPPAALYREPGRRLAFYEQVLDRIHGSAVVTNVALTKQLPFDGELSLSAAAVEFVTIDPNELPVFELRAITPEYFRTLRIPLLEGRSFTSADQSGAMPAAIVDRATAERFWPGESALGKRVGRPWLQEWRTVVGVVGAVRNNELKGESTLALYVPLAQEPSSAAVLVVRTGARLQTIAPLLRDVVREVDPGVPVSDVRPFGELVSDAAGRERVAALLIGAFAGLAMLLGAVGLYGVLSYAVTQRAHELSVRRALGATRRHLLAMVLRDGLALALVGVAIGVPAAGLAARALHSLLYGVDAADPLNLAVVTMVLLATCTAAALVPALRSLRAQPADALRG